MQNLNKLFAFKIWRGIWLITSGSQVTFILCSEITDKNERKKATSVWAQVVFENWTITIKENSDD